MSCCDKQDLMVERSSDLKILDKEVSKDAVIYEVGVINKIVCDSCGSFIRKDEKCTRKFAVEADAIFDSDVCNEDIFDSFE